MDMEPAGSNSSISKQDGGGVVNMTRAVEALTPLLNHPRKTIIKVEGLVLAASLLLLLQLILGSCRRRWHNSSVKRALKVCNGIMFPLIIYTLGTMQSSPIKNSLYPVWAGFLIMASAGTTAVRQYDFYDSFDNKNNQYYIEYARDALYALMFLLLLDPANYNLDTVMNDPKQFMKNAKASSRCVMVLVYVVLFTKSFESSFLISLGYKNRRSLFVTRQKSTQEQDEEARTEESGNDGAINDPHSMNGCKYEVRYGPDRLITIDKIWDYCVNNSAYGNTLKYLCLSCALSRRLLKRSYFGQVVYGETRLLKDHDFVFKKLLPPEGDFQRAFKIIEVELGFCYDFFFTKYYYNFVMMGLPVPVIQSLFLFKISLIIVVGVLAMRKSLVLETPKPIIEVHISEADNIITLLLLSIAVLVELVQAAVYLASNWAQVSLALRCMHVRKCCRQPNAFIFGKVIGFLRMVMISGQLRNKINQHSVIFSRKEQPDPVEVSAEVKGAIARWLRAMFAKNLSSDEETLLRLYRQMCVEYSWALNDLSSRLEVMLIWHIATEYCDISHHINDPSNGNGTTPRSNHRLVHPDNRRNRIIAQDDRRCVAVHLSRYCAYLIGSVPGLLPYNEADTAELAHEVTEERMFLFKSCGNPIEAYNAMKELPGTEDEENGGRIMFTFMFRRGVKLGKQLERIPDADLRWEMLRCFWTEMIISVAASHYTSKKHMQHLENGGEFLTHIWALLSHAGILNLSRI